MLTVSQLARRCGIGRTALLYYESIGLMPPARRTAGNYRSYGEHDVERLKRIHAYRDAGLSLEDVRVLMARKGGEAWGVLERRLMEIDAEMATLHQHRLAILKLLDNRILRRGQMITKEKWVGIMRGSGFTEEQMQNWHAEFERAAPAEHQEFLEFLHIPADEVAVIRQKSREGF
jgi:DNA-binding transcriptional MerR regulator